VFSLAMVFVVLFDEVKKRRVWDNYVVPSLVNIGANRLTKGTSLQKRLLIIVPVISNFVLVYYGLWWGVSSLIGVNQAIIGAFNVQGSITLGIYFIGSVMIYHKNSKKFVGVVFLVSSLGILF
jgi:hypothetical protein